MMRFTKLFTISFTILALLCTSAIALAADTTLKPAIRWPDTRPIGIWHLSEPSLAKGDNPAGWLYGREWMDAYLARAIPVLQSIDAQGVIVWDIEGAIYGEQFYIGAPDLAVAMNPTVDYQQFFKRIRAAGFIPGVLLRPTEFIDGRHKMVDDPYPTLKRKIAYARLMWKCRLFYIDSNIRGVPAQGANGWAQGAVLPATLFARLHKDFPDCLFIPEHEDPAYHLWTFPYRELRLGELRTPDDVLRDIPLAKSAISLNGGDVQGNWNALKAGGCILLMDAWWKTKEVEGYLAALKNGQTPVQ